MVSSLMIFQDIQAMLVIFLLKFGTSRSNSLPNEALLCKTLYMHTMSEPMVCQLRASILSVALSPVYGVYRFGTAHDPRTKF